MMNIQQEQQPQWSRQQPSHGQQTYGQLQWNQQPSPQYGQPQQPQIGFQQVSNYASPAQPAATYQEGGQQYPQPQAQYDRQPVSNYLSPQQQYTQQPQLPTQQSFQQIPTKPPKKGFFSKKVSVPLWAIILTIIVLLGLIVSVGSKSGSTDTSQSNSNTTTTNQVNSSPTNTTQGLGAGQSDTTPTQEPTPTPTHTPKWTTIQTFTGNGNKKTGVFHVGDDWKIVWSCTPSSFSLGQYNLIVDVNNSDNTSVDPAAVNTICKSGNTSDTTEEHQGGDVYLDINSEGAWKIQIQELK